MPKAKLITLMFACMLHNQIQEHAINTRLANRVWLRVALRRSMFTIMRRLCTWAKKTETLQIESSYHHERCEIKALP